jgi:hypothetical protein
MKFKRKKKDKCPFCWCKLTKAEIETYHKCDEFNLNLVSGIICKRYDKMKGEKL